MDGALRAGPLLRRYWKTRSDWCWALAMSPALTTHTILNSLSLNCLRTTGRSRTTMSTPLYLQAKFSFEKTGSYPSNYLMLSVEPLVDNSSVVVRWSTTSPSTNVLVLPPVDFVELWTDVATEPVVVLLPSQAKQ